MSERTMNPALDDGGDRTRLQQRTVRILFGGVLPAGAGSSAAFSATTLLGKDITSSGFLGTMAAAFITIGGALATVPIANYMEAHGRRPGLRLGWMVALSGAVLALMAAIFSFYPLLLIGGFCLGWGNATNLSARYAAADLASETGRAKAIGFVVWAGAFGSALGPTVGFGWAKSIAESVGLPELAGPYALAVLVYAAAAFWIDRQLRPDPLVLVGGIRTDDGPRRSFIDQVRGAGVPLKKIFAHPGARLAVIGMLVGQGVMVGIMTATPLHMDDGAHELRIVGFVISLHIIGMYFFAPLVGTIVDWIGPKPVIAVAGVLLFAGGEFAARTNAEDRLGVFAGLFLVGLGWSFGMIAGSSLLTGSFSVAERVSVQGAADLVMSGAGAVAALTSGVLYEFASYHALSHYAGLIAILLPALALWSIYRTPRQTGRPTPVGAA